MSKCYEDKDIKIELKCKEDNKCYLITEPISEFEIVEAIKNGFLVEVPYGTTGYMATGYIPYRALDDTIFLTRKEAENKLRLEEGKLWKHKCESCIHYEVCELMDFQESGCEHYKDKSLCVEMPVRLGQIVYIIEDAGCECLKPYPLEVRVIACGVDGGGTWVKLKLPLGFKQSQYIGAVSIGKTVFLTKEEAEKKLKEIEK